MEDQQMECEILLKYDEYFKRLSELKQQEVEALIIFLENEVIDNNLDSYGIIGNWINLLRKVELKMKLTLDETRAIGRASHRSYILLKELCKNEKKEVKLLNMINKERKS